MFGGRPLKRFVVRKEVAISPALSLRQNRLKAENFQRFDANAFVQRELGFGGFEVLRRTCANLIVAPAPPVAAA